MLIKSAKLIAFHIMMVITLAVGAYAAVRNGVNIQGIIQFVALASLSISFFIGFFMKIQGSFLDNLYLTLPMAGIAIIIFPIYAFLEPVLDAIYMYFLFMVPYHWLPLVGSFDAITVLLLSLSFFVTSTLGAFTANMFQLLSGKKKFPGLLKK